MRLRLLCCEVLYREACAAVARSPHIVDVEFLPKGLHDLGTAPMRARIQAALDRVDEARYDAILLGYGLCNNGLAGLRARAIPLVLPRAHDCITLFLGCRRRCTDYFVANPGTFFKTTGWMERGEATGELSQLSVLSRAGLSATYAELVEKYGEENARYLFETLYDHTRNYRQLTFIEMGVEPDGSWEAQARQEADRRGWRFEKVQGDMGLIERLVGGLWRADEFLVVPPGQRIAARFDDDIVAAEPGEEEQ